MSTNIYLFLIIISLLLLQLHYFRFNNYMSHQPITFECWVHENQLPPSKLLFKDVKDYEDMKKTIIREYSIKETPGNVNLYSLDPTNNNNIQPLDVRANIHPTPLDIYYTVLTPSLSFNQTTQQQEFKVGQILYREYNDYDIEFVERDSFFDIIVSNLSEGFNYRGTVEKQKQVFFLIAGGSGTGKSRAAYELSRIPEAKLIGIDQILRRSLQSAIYIEINFLNGSSYHPQLDSLSADIRIGMRLAISSGIYGCKVIDHLIASSSRFTINQVIDDLIISVQQNGSPITQSNPLTIILHLDEFQQYIKSLPQSDNNHKSESFKLLLDAIGEIMVKRKDIFLIPVCTGTSSIDIILIKYHGLFETGLGDTGFIPREISFYLRCCNSYLFEFSKRCYDKISRLSMSSITNLKVVKKILLLAITQTPVTLSTKLGELDGNQITVNQIRMCGNLYLEQIDTVSTDSEESAHVDHKRKSKLFDLTPQKSQKSYSSSLPSRLSTSSTDSSTDSSSSTSSASSSNSVEERDSTQYTIFISFYNMVVLNSLLVDKRLFPSELLFFPSPTKFWTWKDFEELFPRICIAKINAHVKLKHNLTIQLLLKGVYGIEEITNDILTSFPKKVIKLRIQLIIELNINNLQQVIFDEETNPFNAPNFEDTAIHVCKRNTETIDHIFKLTGRQGITSIFVQCKFSDNFKNKKIYQISNSEVIELAGHFFSKLDDSISANTVYFLVTNRIVDKSVIEDFQKKKDRKKFKINQFLFVLSYHNFNTFFTRTFAHRGLIDTNINGKQFKDHTIIN
ncbi:hypothetical protein PPL_01250 [Heterostelium album PN500]|uniref:Uncharacterized protein n=1 Tax=Heterostelium pallidum (strain ATCC 26659 / Pp 5 / PN500) TaxID=670386 RepID=D3AYJ0_HETP5|nr:hypothetical protein PPL_01250 [Heterostelium album PN500]EFA86017.1 hypothetical protein PPL_01250 [Heterostelium album PN500]|eukprot:XP_020438123.1 hypothetical protein PPL_01250 [Heterostelium album PN500]